MFCFRQKAQSPKNVLNITKHYNVSHMFFYKKHTHYFHRFFGDDNGFSPVFSLLPVLLKSYQTLMGAHQSLVGVLKVVQ